MCSQAVRLVTAALGAILAVVGPIALLAGYGATARLLLDYAQLAFEDFVVRSGAGPAIWFQLAVPR